MSESGNVLVEREGAVSIVTLNAPSRGRALLTGPATYVGTFEVSL